MSMITLEVELDHGRVVTKGNEPLPEHAFALLPILPALPVNQKPIDLFQYYPELQGVVLHEDASLPLNS